MTAPPSRRLVRGRTCASNPFREVFWVDSWVYKSCNIHTGNCWFLSTFKANLSLNFTKFLESTDKHLFWSLEFLAERLKIFDLSAASTPSGTVRNSSVFIVLCFCRIQTNKPLQLHMYSSSEMCFQTFDWYCMCHQLNSLIFVQFSARGSLVLNWLRT